MISVTITREQLEKAEACSEGMALFEACCRRFKGGVRKVKIDEWTPLHTAWLHSAYRSFASWLESRGIIPRANLSGENLSGANLSWANLSGADFSGADFSWANLSGSYYPYGDLPDTWDRDANGYLRRKP